MNLPNRFVHRCVALLVFGLFWASMVFASETSIPKTLDGVEFVSVKKFQLSVLPTKIVEGNRVLKFKDGEFTYMPADYMETGKYDWDAKRGELRAESISGKKFKATYNPKTKVLTWDGVQYKAKQAEQDNVKVQETKPAPPKKP